MFFLEYHQYFQLIQFITTVKFIPWPLQAISVRNNPLADFGGLLWWVTQQFHNSWYGTATGESQIIVSECINFVLVNLLDCYEYIKFIYSLFKLPKVFNILFKIQHSLFQSFIEVSTVHKHMYIYIYIYIPMFI